MPCTSQFGFSLHVRTCRGRFPHHENGWADCVQIWHIVRDRLAGCLAEVSSGPACTCARAGVASIITRTAGPIALKFGSWHAMRMYSAHVQGPLLHLAGPISLKLGITQLEFCHHLCAREYLTISHACCVTTNKCLTGLKLYCGNTRKFPEMIHDTLSSIGEHVMILACP